MDITLSGLFLMFSFFHMIQYYCMFSQEFLVMRVFSMRIRLSAESFGVSEEN